MIDFSKQLDKGAIVAKIDPIDIYNSLDRHGSASGPLRDAQIQVLTEWYKNRQTDKDVIVKMHTGEGKTLVGLLMLMSKLNSGSGPCLYISPNMQLAEQAAKDAVKFGVPHEVFRQDNKEIPLSFTEGKKILITYVQKVFNGKTKFNLDNKGEKVGTVVLDDSHACIDSIRNSCTIRIQRESGAYIELLNLFEVELKSQGAGYYSQLKNNSSGEVLLPVPYWGWYDKVDDVLKILSEYSEEDKGITFAFPLLMNELEKCSAYITCYGIEIVPDFSLIHRFTSFSQARQRILMSATTQDDSYFIKGLDMNPVSVTNPIINSANKWSGEKMILFPSLISQLITPEKIRTVIPKWAKSNNISCLIPGFAIYEYAYKGKPYVQVTRNNIFQILTSLENGIAGVPYVFANRYDGIDLADDMCRILVIDNSPIFDSLSDRYEEQCREDSEVIKVKVAQKIEQGLGRSVRSQKDYSVILIIGEDITNFMNSSRYQKFFSSQTKCQIKIAEEVTQMALDEVKMENNPYKTFIDLISQCLKRDPGWKAFYEKRMKEMPVEDAGHPYLHIYEKEREAEYSLSRNDIANACKIYRELFDLSSTDSEKGWYMQKVAKYTYFTNKADSVKQQDKAHELNHYLLKTNNLGYKKIKTVDDARIQNIIKIISKFPTYSDFNLYVEGLIGKLVYGISANKFEQSIKEIGILLGFGSQRPDQEYNAGPDNLWAIGSKYYIAFECKNQVLGTRITISKHEIGQLYEHKAWFANHYGDAECIYFFIHQSDVIAKDANLDFEARVIMPDDLNKLILSIRSFVKSFQGLETTSLSEKTVNEQIIANKLQVSDLKKMGWVVRCS